MITLFYSSLLLLLTMLVSIALMQIFHVLFLSTIMLDFLFFQVIFVALELNSRVLLSLTIIRLLHDFDHSGEIQVIDFESPIQNFETRIISNALITVLNQQSCFHNHISTGDFEHQFLLIYDHNLLSFYYFQTRDL